jgi:hypothetical protein
MEYFSTIKNEIMLFASKCMKLDIIMLSKVSQAHKDKGPVFPHMWKLDLLHECTHTYIYDLPHTLIHTHTHVHTHTHTHTHTYIYIKREHDFNSGCAF